MEKNVNKKKNHETFNIVTKRGRAGVELQPVDLRIGDATQI